jgi:hypothetical protein
MKPKLLITMGDSNTEGVGCWSDDTHDTTPETYGKNIERFHKLGWPPRLQIKLNYDYLINLGMGGTSDSHQLKSFIENITSEELEKYEVLVVWMMTFPGRFSFYRNKKVFSVQASNVTDGKFSEIDRLAMSYMTFINNLTEDSALEQLYHIRLFNRFCEGANIKFLFCSLDKMQYEFLKETASEHFMTPNNLNMYGKEIYPSMDAYSEYKSRLCKHPNEQGYEFISENIFNIIQENFSNLVNYEHVVEVQREWRGVKQW